jgi:hypothetical protein
MENNKQTKKILAFILIVGGLIAIPFLEWPEGNYNERVPNQLKDPVEQVEPTDPTVNQTEGDTISVAVDDEDIY